MKFFFVSDLHGNTQKFENLFSYIHKKTPEAVFFGGDLLPLISPQEEDIPTFINNTIFAPLERIKKDIPSIQFFFILGNDDPRIYESIFFEAEEKQLISYVHEKTVPFSDLFVTGYAYVPPTPFQLKDWERYDVSRFVDVGVISPEEGLFSVPIDKNSIRYNTIKKDLDELVQNAPANKTIFLFHSPPYDTNLDRAKLDGKMIDYTPLDVHIGSIAIKRFISNYKPFITLHGHVHESSQITGKWQHNFEKTISFSAAYNGDELAVIEIDTNNPQKAVRTLL
jgi:Icc-related predicted phosphoesterase